MSVPRGSTVHNCKAFETSHNVYTYAVSHYDTKRRIMRLSLYSDLSLQITHPAVERLPTPPGSKSPTLFEYIVVWVLLRITKTIQVKVLWDGSYGFPSLSEKTRKVNLLHMSLQRRNFLLSYLKTLSLDLARTSVNSRPPYQHTGALPTELTRRQ